jgi:uncharacterized SAM-binding protein YcdF (DUF218 family)
MTSFILLKILSGLIFPPASLAVGVLVCLLLRLVGRRRIAAWVLGLALAQTLIMAFPPVGDAMIGRLEDQARVAANASPRCCFDAIVVLGGGIVPSLPPARQDPRPTETADRIWGAVQLYRAKVAPRIIVSGGSFLAEQGLASKTEADSMQLFLHELGVPESAIVSEGHSINTIENLHEVHRIVGDAPVALVTSAYHMPRVLGIAAREKLAVAAFPVDFRALRDERPFWDNWMPSIDGIAVSSTAMKEMIALAIDWRRSGGQR